MRKPEPSTLDQLIQTAEALVEAGNKVLLDLRNETVHVLTRGKPTPPELMHDPHDPPMHGPQQQVFGEQKFPCPKFPDSILAI